MCNILTNEELAFPENVLVVIGNGFDLSHGIYSKYEDFYDFLSDNKKGDLCFWLDNFFNSSGDLWSDFENALGAYDAESILDECRPDEEIDLDHYMRSTAAIEDSPLSLLTPVMEELKTEFSKWVNSISLDGVEKKFKNLSPSSLYLTFNYLETLEKIYCIPEDKIFHIHGSRLNRGEYVFGHNNHRTPIYTDDDTPYYEEEGMTNVINIMNEFTKQYVQNIEQCSLFNQSLQTIRNIVVIGHSLSESDRPYFEKIQEYITPETLWRISYHLDDNLPLLQQRCQTLKIKKREFFRV